MQFSNSVLLSVAAALASLTSAAPLERRSSQLPKIDFNVVRYGASSFNESVISPLSVHRKSVRSAASSGVNVPLENEYSLYLADLEIGTPGQKIQVDIDTGSSDLWVPGAGTKSNAGTYDHTKSSTYKKDKDGFKISYGDGSSASGDWAKETVKIGDATVKDLEFGDATTQNVGQSILGVGFTGNEAAAQQESGSFTYDNLPLQLKKQGVISKAAYSLFLNDVDAKSGSILFGGIDKSKIDGDLKTLKIQNVDDSGSQTDKPVAFFVNLDKIQAGGNNFAEKTYPALLDSGTTLIYAPQDIAESIGKKYGEYNQQYGGYLTSCSTTGDDFEFTFDDKTIKVPFKNLLYSLKKAGSGSSSESAKSDSDDQCLVGVLGSQSEYYILGDGFLRSAYVYYDIDNAEIGLGQAKYDSTSSNIVEYWASW